MKAFTVRDATFTCAILHLHGCTKLWYIREKVHPPLHMPLDPMPATTQILPDNPKIDFLFLQLY